jgi:hypothetical protein
MSEILEFDEHENKLRFLARNEGLMVSEDSRIRGLAVWPDQRIYIEG